MLLLILAPLATPAAAEGEHVIIAFGDSLTQGYGLAPEQGLVPRLEGWLRAQGAAVRLVNAGVSGDTTAGGAARIGWTLAEPADGIIVALGGNDMLRGLPPAEARANLDAILTAAGGKGLPVLLVGMAAPGNYGPAYKAEFEAIYPDLATRHGALLAENLMAPLMGALEDPAARARLIQPDGIHPSAAGVDLVVEALGPRVLDLLARIEAGG